MQGKVVVISGATSGIGQVAAEQLAAMGARIVQIARDRGRGEEALRRLKAKGPVQNHAIHYADLALLPEMKRVASEIASSERRIDVLINNAGALYGSRELTPDGLERTFALNHMAYFVVTMALRDRLIDSRPSRVVNTASNAHVAVRLHLDDLQSAGPYRRLILSTLLYGSPGLEVYARSKLCNVLFTRELARCLTGTEVTANCLHPGFVATRFGDNSGGITSAWVRAAKHFAISPERGAETLVYLASSPDVAGVTGQYFVKCKPTRPSTAALDDAGAQQLWVETERLARSGAV